LVMYVQIIFWYRNKEKFLLLAYYQIMSTICLMLFFTILLPASNVNFSCRVDGFWRSFRPCVKIFCPEWQEWFTLWLNFRKLCLYGFMSELDYKN